MDNNGSSKKRVLSFPLDFLSESTGMKISLFKFIENENNNSGLVWNHDKDRK